MRTALSIAGSDPTGGAGLQLDLQVFRSQGVHGAAVVTALTVQDTAKVHQVLPAFPSVVLDQIRVLLRDFVPGAIKLGMLASDDVARSVALGLDDLPAEAPVARVIDPVLAASDGTPLLERRAWGTLVELIGGSTLATPNLFEAGALAGRDVSDAAGMEAAARAWLGELGAAAVLVKGGHREGPPDDLLARRGAAGAELTWLPGERVPGGPVHGTGCALSAAVTARLARGETLEAAVHAGRAFVVEAIRRAGSPGHGARILGLE